MNLITQNYWGDNPERVSQKFYISLCIYISANLDYAVGLDLMQQRKLNWSITASYYSMVHAARMISFIAFGDFPQSHSQIIKLFSPSNVQDVQFNWFRYFTESNYNDYSPHSFGNKSDLRTFYSRYLEKVDQLFETFGQILEKSKNLRNDSNYEALLIAHEFQHSYITECFERLSVEMINAALSCLNIAQNCFLGYLRLDEGLTNFRNQFRYLTSRYLKQRVYDSIKYKLTSSEILNAIRDLNYPIEQYCNLNSSKILDDAFISDIEGIEDDISMSIFNEKTELMSRYKRKIDELSIVIPK